LKSLIILGAGGHGKVVAETALISNRFKSISFLDDKFEHKKNSFTFRGINLIGKLNYAECFSCKKTFEYAMVAFGDSNLRLDRIRKLNNFGYEMPSIIHPSAWISPSCNIQQGTVVFAQAAIQSDVIIGEGNIINTGSSVDHDCILGEGVHICPGARIAGNVHIGAKSTIGIGSSINKGIKIGSNVIVGAGAAVVRDIGNNLIAKGVPAKAKINLKE